MTFAIYCPAALTSGRALALAEGGGHSDIGARALNFILSGTQTPSSIEFRAHGRSPLAARSKSSSSGRLQQSHHNIACLALPARAALACFGILIFAHFEFRYGDWAIFPVTLSIGLIGKVFTEKAKDFFHDGLVFPF